MPQGRGSSSKGDGGLEGLSWGEQGRRWGRSGRGGTRGGARGVGLPSSDGGGAWGVAQPRPRMPAGSVMLT